MNNNLPSRRIQVGLADSPAARQLIADGQTQIDFLEVHGPQLESARMLFPEFPMLLHNSLYQWSLSDFHAMHKQDARRITAECLDLAFSPWYSVHLGFSAVELEFRDEYMQALSPVLSRKTIFDNTCRTVNALQDLAGVPILLENMDYNPGGAYETICEPEFICSVIETTSAGFLLDLAHVQVSAAAMNRSVQAYLNDLPLDMVYQIHVNRPGKRNGRLVDSHDGMQDEDYDLLAQTLTRCRCRAITLEYGQDAEVIVSQLEEIRKITGNHG